MVLRWRMNRQVRYTLGTLVALTVPAALVEGECPCRCQPAPCYAPCPVPCPAPTPTLPATPPAATPTEPKLPAKEPEKKDATESQAAAPAATPETPAFGADTLAAVSGGEGAAVAAPGGYLDNAIPMTMFRLRYDAGFGLNRPDRAEYFYASWGELAFHPHGINGGGVFFDPHAKGPTILPASLNYQEVSAYTEYAFNTRVSAFLDVPYRFLNFRHLLEDSPESEMKRPPFSNAPNPGSPFFPEPENGGVEAAPDTDPNGFSDLQVGFKAALLADPDQYLTFQLTAYAPTGDPHRGLGTGHVSLEPALLFDQRLDRLTFQGEFKVWVPVGGGAAEGNILIYGLGLGYDVYQTSNLRITPITEVVGWTVLNGFESIFGQVVATAPPGLELPVTHGVRDASGDTIVNLKLGVRTYFGEHSDVYAGWGHALTGDRWYQDIVRVEYRFIF